MTDIELLIEKFVGQVRGLMAQLEAKTLTPEEWQQLMDDLLARYHTAAYMAGRGSSVLSQADLDTIANQVQVQLSFLDNFRLVISSTGEWQPAWNGRAEMYAESPTTTYWEGKVGDLPLPAMPGQGTQCLSRCKCSWRIEPLDAAKGDYDAYWTLGPADHCQTCLQRSEDWNPIRIRDGRLVV